MSAFLSGRRLLTASGLSASVERPLQGQARRQQQAQAACTDRTTAARRPTVRRSSHTARLRHTARPPSTELRQRTAPQQSAACRRDRGHTACVPSSCRPAHGGCGDYRCRGSFRSVMAWMACHIQLPGFVCWCLTAARWRCSLAFGRPYMPCLFASMHPRYADNASLPHAGLVPLTV